MTQRFTLLAPVMHTLACMEDATLRGNAVRVSITVAACNCIVPLLVLCKRNLVARTVGFMRIFYCI